MSPGASSVCQVPEDQTPLPFTSCAQSVSPPSPGRCRAACAVICQSPPVCRRAAAAAACRQHHWLHDTSGCCCTVRPAPPPIDSPPARWPIIGHPYPPQAHRVTARLHMIKSLKPTIVRPPVTAVLWTALLSTPPTRHREPRQPRLACLINDTTVPLRHCRCSYLSR